MHAAFHTHIILRNFKAAAKSAALQTNGMVHNLSVCAFDSRSPPYEEFHKNIRS